jgi:hypothetical protein
VWIIYNSNNADLSWLLYRGGIAGDATCQDESSTLSVSTSESERACILGRVFVIVLRTLCAACACVDNVNKRLNQCPTRYLFEMID